MSKSFVDDVAASGASSRSMRPADLPHGLLALPVRVREQIEAERAKYPPEAFARAEMQLVNEWTLQHYFEDFGQEVLYRATPQGPEVLAVGFDEIFTLTKGRDPGAMTGLKTWMPG
jgi:hypothetical protein